MIPALPAECVHEIFGYLPPEDAICCSRVCREWHRALSRRHVNSAALLQYRRMRSVPWIVLRLLVLLFDLMGYLCRYSKEAVAKGLNTLPLTTMLCLDMVVIIVSWWGFGLGVAVHQNRALFELFCYAVVLTSYLLLRFYLISKGRLVPPLPFVQRICTAAEWLFTYMQLTVYTIYILRSIRKTLDSYDPSSYVFTSPISILCLFVKILVVEVATYPDSIRIPIFPMLPICLGFPLSIVLDTTTRLYHEILFLAGVIVKFGW